MILDRVTITGADNSIEPHHLAALSEEFPFVEWGILVSKSNTGSSYRYPSLTWIDRLRRMALQCRQMKLSLHVCGRWVRDMLIGQYVIPESELFLFDRVQLNFHAEQTRCRPPQFHAVLRKNPGKQYIFQIDGAGGNEHLESLMGENGGDDGYVDAVGLFDLSGGAGLLPGEWPKPIYMKDDVSPLYHGYAGGLGPDNLAEQIPLVAKAAGDCRVWIDMESRVRNHDDKQFDLDKVRRCLEIARPFVVGH